MDTADQGSGLVEVSVLEVWAEPAAVTDDSLLLGAIRFYKLPDEDGVAKAESIDERGESQWWDGGMFDCYQPAKDWLEQRHNELENERNEAALEYIRYFGEYLRHTRANNMILDPADPGKSKRLQDAFWGAKNRLRRLCFHQPATVEAYIHKMPEYWALRNDY